MSPEERFLLKCISSFIRQETVLIPEERFDRNLFFLLAKAHSLEGIVYSCCKNWVLNDEAGRGFRKAFYRDVFCSINRTSLLEEIVRLFSEAEIPFVCMKGMAFRDYYPIPELRSMGDMDIIIHTKDRQSADEILCKKLGYRKYIDNHAVWTYNLDESRYPFEVEVHDHMFYENLANHVDYRAYFDHVWEHSHHAAVFGIESENMFVPDEDFHFLYLMTHTAKHIINNGSGFRAFLDMVFMTKQCDLDWDWLKTELERLELLDFTKTCFALCERWFDVEMPFGNKSLDESFFQEITEKTFRDGVFGLENRQNAGAHTAKEIKRGEGSYISGALTLTIKKLFPSYRDMQLIPWYSWVDKKPWLMPAAWVYRWIYCIKNKRRAGMDLLTEPFSLRDTVEKREALIRSWGL